MEEVECAVLTEQSPALQAQLLSLGQSTVCQYRVWPVHALTATLPPLLGCSSGKDPAGLQAWRWRMLWHWARLCHLSAPSHLHRHNPHRYSSRKTLKSSSKNSAVFLFIYKQLLHLEHRKALWEAPKILTPNRFTARDWTTLWKQLWRFRHFLIGYLFLNSCD